MHHDARDSVMHLMLGTESHDAFFCFNYSIVCIFRNAVKIEETFWQFSDIQCTSGAQFSETIKTPLRKPLVIVAISTGNYASHLRSAPGRRTQGT